MFLQFNGYDYVLKQFLIFLRKIQPLLCIEIPCKNNCMQNTKNLIKKLKKLKKN